MSWIKDCILKSFLVTIHVPGNDEENLSLTQFSPENIWSVLNTIVIWFKKSNFWFSIMAIK